MSIVNGDMPLYLTCGNNHDGIILILGIEFNLLFLSFSFHRS